MAKGINISIASDTRQFQRAVKSGVIDPLDDAAEVLQDVEKAGDDAGTALERSMKDSQRSTDGLTDEFKNLQREIDDSKKKTKDFGDAGRSAGRDYERGMDRAEDGVSNFRDEARQTAQETASSFGSVEDAIDGVQELAAQGLGNFGPVGVGAGIAVAGAIGLGVTAFEKLQEAEAESRERVAEWADAYIEANAEVLTSTQTLARARAIFGDAEAYKLAAENARLWGVEVETAAFAMAGETWALAAARESLTERERELADAQHETIDVGRDFSTMQDGQTAEIHRARDAFDLLTREMQDGRAGADEYSTGLRITAQSATDATREVDEFGDSVYTLPDGKQIYVDAETGRATDKVDDIEARIYSIPDGHATVHVGVNDSAVDRFMRKPLVRQMTVNAVVRPGERLWY